MPYLLLRTSFHLLLAPLLFSIPAVCYGQAGFESKLEELSTQAQAAQQRGDYPSAAKAYEELAKLRPEMGEIWANAGLMYQFSNDYSHADQNFQAALRRNAKLYVPNLFFGLNRLRSHQPRAAVAYLKIAVALNPEDEQAPLGLGQAYAGIGDYANAVRWLEGARRINPRDPTVWYELGTAYSELQSSAALQLKNLDPEDVHARALVADSFAEQGRAKDAVAIYEKFRSEEHPPCLRSELGFAYLQLGSTEQATRTFEEDLRSRSGCLLTNLGLARLAATSGDFAGMLHQMHEVEERDSLFLNAYLRKFWNGVDPEQTKAIVTNLQNPDLSQDPISAVIVKSATSEPPAPASRTQTRSTATTAGPEQLWTEGRYTACRNKILQLKTTRTPAQTRLLEQCAFYAGDYRLALQTSLRAVEISPRDLDALYWQAKSAEILAATSFAEMNALAPDSPEGHLLMAELHRAREEYGLAESEYDEVLKSAKSETDLINANIGLAYLHIHDFNDNKAFEELQAALKSDPSNAAANSLLGQVLVRRQQYEDAIPHLKLALRASPTSSLPEERALLAKCYASLGQNAAAINELKAALPADIMGDFHYQLYQIYLKMGDQKAAAEALQKSQQLRQRKSEAEQRHLRLLTPSQ